MPKTEDIAGRFRDLDLWPDAEILDAIWQGQLKAIASLKPALGTLEKAVVEASDRLSESDGRIAFAGAGTSGLLAMQDGMELNPTFGWPLERILFLMAGGAKARLAPIGASEDDRDEAGAEARQAAFTSWDVVIAVAASGSTPYTMVMAEMAREKGALVIAIVNNPDAPIAQYADHTIVLDTGAEVLCGSTRMAAGTAQKAALTSLSTLLMTRLGFVVGGHMVNMVVDNEKLRQRALHIVSDIAGVDKDIASKAMDAADNDIKRAVLIAQGCAPAEARDLLAKNNGNLRRALDGRSA